MGSVVIKEPPATVEEPSASVEELPVVPPQPTVTIEVNGHSPNPSVDDRTAKVLEEVKRRKAIAEAAVKPKPVAEPHNRITSFPFAYALGADYLHRFCWYCLKEESLKTCAGKCGMAGFCSAECERLAQKDHKPECAGYKRLKKGVERPDVEVRLLGRIAHRYKVGARREALGTFPFAAIQTGADKKIVDFYADRTSKRTIMEIWAHETDFANDNQYTAQFNEIYQKLSKFYAASDLPSRDDVFKLHCRDFVNRHAISDLQYQNEVGKGLYLDLCSYDHSCAPDTVFYSVGFKSILVGLKPKADISDNRKSFYSYVDLMSTFAQRQKQLKDTWFFDCQCTRCTDPNDHLLTAVKCQFCTIDDLDIPVIVQGQKATKTDGRSCCPNCRKAQERFHVMEANYLMRDINNFIDRMDEFSPADIAKQLTAFLTSCNLLLPNINAYRTRVVLNYVNWAELNPEAKMRAFVSIEPCLRHCFPPHHPGLAFYLRDVAHFCAEAQFYHDAISYLTEALDIMERIFIEHEIIPQMRAKRTDLQRRHAKRAQHRRTHRAATPLPPLPPVNTDTVEFVSEDDTDDADSIDFDSVE
ncbi:Zinc finger domain containing protein [Aphelenchoides fujianensis]|nr:Zinc finger domain containing protein [Aphelenchoides fujianensis]